MSKAYEIEYTVQIWKEGNQYVAHAMPLDVMSSGLTPEEAQKLLMKQSVFSLEQQLIWEPWLKSLKRWGINKLTKFGSVLLG